VREGETAGAPESRDTAGRDAPVYDETIVTNGIRVPFVPAIITPAVEKPMRKGRYEGGEAAALRALLRSGDRVLELGAGVGLLSTIAATCPGVEAVTAVEANPDLVPLIRETWRINGVANARLINAVVTVVGGGEAEFYLRRDFWASSMEAGSRPYERSVPVPKVAIADLIGETRPTVISCDLEGGEAGLFDAADLSGVRAVVMELHPKVYGQDGVRSVHDRLEAAGLRLQPVERRTTVRTFLRDEARPGTLPGAAPRVLVVTCMKDEGPFILEWIAWHRAIGVTDIVVFTNDISDGSERLLDRLDELGLVRHLPNPAIALKSPHFNPAAVALIPHLPQFRRADTLISMDVDEFINVRIGDGSLGALFDRVGYFDALSMSELNHGSNGQMTFEPGLVTEQFPRHESEAPGRLKALRGVKTITRIGPLLARPRNHRPDFVGLPEDVVWLDGSGRPLTTLLDDPTLNGHDVRGTYDLVSLDHFPLRSLESYLVKMARGDAVVSGKQVSQRYWRMRNRNDHLTSTFERQQPAFRAELARLMDDPVLRAAHDATCAAHGARAKALLELAPYRARRDWILENAWAPPA
jgi:FkbM family methyltransferase